VIYDLTNLKNPAIGNIHQENISQFHSFVMAPSLNKIAELLTNIAKPHRL